MRFNTLFKLSSLIGFAGLAYGSGYRMTFYGLNGNRPSDSAIPACGLDVDYNTDYYVALNKEQYYESQVRKDNPNTATVCDKCVKISYQGKWVVGRIVDSCPGCPNHGLDVSPKIFEVFAHQDVGVIYMDWEYANCSLLGKSGSGSGSSSGSSSSEKTTKKKTTTKRTTTTTTKKVTSSVKQTTVIVTKNVATKTTNQSQTLPSNVNIPKLDDVIINASNNTSAKTAQVNRTVSVKQVPTETSAPVAETKQNTVVDQTISENKDEGGNTYAVPLTGAFVVTGAAGVALLYAKRDSKNVNALKEKFPEAFSNIKRSISRGGTVVKRSLSQSGRALKRSLSKKGDMDMGMNNNTTVPHFRTKKEYRDSLDAHYPLQPVQLYDPPVPSATTSDYSSVPQYNLQCYDTNNDDGNLRIDFHDSYRYNM